MRSKLVIATAAAALFLAGSASAHSIKQGYQVLSPGDITIWVENWHSGSPFEGTLTLTGILGNPYPATSVPFTAFVPYTLPDPPLDAVFGISSSYGSDFKGDWQGAPFTGLPAGDYSYAMTGFATVYWTPASGMSLTGTFTVPPHHGVPDAGATMGLLGIGLCGLFGLARKGK